MSFAIACTPRSGSKYLARLLNLSTAWQVEHEPTQGDILRRFADCPYRYGEVGFHCLEDFSELAVRGRGVIVRRPADVLISCWNRFHVQGNGPTEPGEVLDRMVENYVRWWTLLDECARLSRTTRVFQFDELTTSVEAVRRCARAMNVTGLWITEADLYPVNATPRSPGLARCVDDLPDRFRRAVEETRWFEDRWVAAGPAASSPRCRS